MKYKADHILSASKRLLYIILIMLSVNSPLISQWQQITNIPLEYQDSYWLEIQFLKEDPDYGWACGYNGKLLRTTDGGNSWIGSSISGGGQLESIHFVNRNVGYLVSVGGENFRSNV